MTHLLRICLLLLMALLTASCKYKLVTDHLQPTNINTSEHIASNYNKVACSVDMQGGTNTGMPDPKVIWVGYIRDYDPGSGLVPCWQWSNGVYRGALRFDFKKYQGKKIASAVLNLSLGQAQYESGKLASNEGAWIKTIGLATSEWWLKHNPYMGDLFPWKPIPNMPELPHGLNPPDQKDFPVKYSFNQYQILVKETVQKWIDGTEPNMGFILIGTNEKTVAKNADSALSPINFYSLDITYSVSK